LWILPGRSKRKEEEIVMTLSQLIRLFEGIAMQQPSINMIVQNDVYRINSAPSLKYGVFAWTQGQHTGNINGMTTFSFTFFYVDRLKENQSNQIEIQSVGCETLGNILRTLDENDVEVAQYTMQTFNQRFTDECAGVFCNVSLSVQTTSVCAETYPDFTKDYNSDFLIY
jgi:hypothetical protein